MKKHRNNSGKQNSNEHFDDPIFNKKADFISDKLREKKDEIEKPIYDFLEASINRMKPSPFLGPLRKFPRAEPSSQRKIEAILDKINKKREDNEIDDSLMDLLKKSIGQ